MKHEPIEYVPLILAIAAAVMVIGVLALATADHLVESPRESLEKCIGACLGSP